MPRNPWRRARSVSSSLRSSFHAVPYNRRGTFTPAIDTVRELAAADTCSGADEGVGIGDDSTLNALKKVAVDGEPAVGERPARTADRHDRVPVCTREEDDRIVVRRHAREA